MVNSQPLGSTCGPNIVSKLLIESSLFAVLFGREVQHEIAGMTHMKQPLNLEGFCWPTQKTWVRSDPTKTLFIIP